MATGSFRIPAGGVKRVYRVVTVRVGGDEGSRGSRSAGARSRLRRGLYDWHYLTGKGRFLDSAAPRRARPACPGDVDHTWQPNQSLYFDLRRPPTATLAAWFSTSTEHSLTATR